MSAIVASSMINPTANPMSRFHDLNNPYQSRTGGRQRSSSFTQKSINSTIAPPGKGQYQLDLPLSYSENNLAAKSDRINLVPTSSTSTKSTATPLDTLKDLPVENDAVSTGRSRSNTLTSTNGLPTIVSTQFDHIIRPRRPSLVNRPSNPSIQVIAPALSSTVGANNNDSTAPSQTRPHSTYPPPLLPQYSDSVDIGELSLDDTPTTTTTKSRTGDFELGFMPRILILVGLFGMSLGGLYLIAQVLPPLSLPKSIDDVKVDAEILQEFATATYEGWLRTFWVFSVVYLWKQCFGIPGSAFLNILAGALYGPWFGTLLTSALTTVGSVFAYFMSFFLMEPIMNRYASTRLDQMRLQIQKKTRSSSSKSDKATATSSAVETSVTGTTPISDVYSPSLSPPTSSAAPGQRGTLRTRSSSFTVRGTSTTEQGERVNVNYGYLINNPPSSYPDEIEIQENEGLLTEDSKDEKSNVVTSSDNEENSTTTANEEDDDGPSLFMQLLLIRLFPLTPYWFINLASPLVGVPVIPFMTSMFLGCMPYNYICTQAGAILGEIHELRDIYQQPWILFQIVMVLVLSAGATWASKRWTRKQQQEQDQKKSRSSEDDLNGHHPEEGNRLLENRGFENEVDYRQVESTDSYSMEPLGKSAERPGSKRDSAVIDMSAYRY
ncbi:Transmembrane protein 41A [Podila epicladia]|nr:Transmembrane protein 41A [Podila epicladia]KAG0094848.1 Transmembrane protein 41A [Podila epicladia]